MLAPQTQPVRRAGPDNRWTRPPSCGGGLLDSLWRWFWSPGLASTAAHEAHLDKGETENK